MEKFKFAFCRRVDIFKNIFLFIIFTSVIIFVNGFFISKSYAEEVSYSISGGIDTTSGEAITFDSRDMTALLFSDDNPRKASDGYWPASGTYEEDLYIEFNFDIDIPSEAVIKKVEIINDYRNSTDTEIHNAKLEVWSGNSFVNIDLSTENTTLDILESIDITNFLDNSEKINNTKIRFLAYRNNKGNSKTSHDFIGINVSYRLRGDIGSDFTLIEDDFYSDTTLVLDKSPYVILTPLKVVEDAVLNIEDGVVVKFDNSGSLMVNGILNILGDGIGVYFTSLHDDSIYGDTNNNGNETVPDNNKWGGLVIDSPDFSSLNGLRYSHASSNILFFDTFVEVNDSFLDKCFYSFNSNIEVDNLSASCIYLFDESVISIKNSNIYDKTKTPISLYSESRFMAKDSNFSTDSNGSVFNVFDNSYLELDGVEIKNNNSQGDGINVYDFKSKLNIKNSIIENVLNGVTILNNASADIYNTIISAINRGVTMYGESILQYIEGDYDVNNLVGGYLNISNSSINGASIAGVSVYDGTDTKHVVNLIKNKIYNNNHGVAGYGANITGKYNSIYDNNIGAFNVDDFAKLDFVKNYWGDVSGPEYKNNIEGKGDSITDNVLYNPFLSFDPTDENIRNPVILVPGITGSYLMKDYGDKGEIWPNVLRLIPPTNITDEFLNDLILNEDGRESIEYPIKTGDVIRKIANVHVFDLLIERLKEEGYEEGKDLFVFPYDWRFSVEDGAVSLNNKIEEILNITGHYGVDVVAHSMGGLIAKKYIKDYGEEKIDQIVFLGTPQLGAPKAFKVLMFGDSMGFALSLNKSKNIKLNILNPDRAKIISQNMPSVYELLPSQRYIEKNNNYIIDNMGEKDGIASSELDYNSTKNYMVSEGRNSKMFSFAEDTHKDIDDLDLSNISSYNFIGCGSPTIGKIKLTRERAWYKLFFDYKDDYEIGYTDGDETVPLVSAREVSTNKEFYVKGISHGSLPASSSVISSIINLFKYNSYYYDSTISEIDSFCGIEGDVLATHSPVYLHIYDEDGNHTGPTDSGDIEYEIPGVTYDQIEDINYVFLPKGINYRIVTIAKEEGGFTLKIEEQQGEEIIKEHKWILIPQPTSVTKGEIFIGPDYDHDSLSINIDNDGDGVFDIKYDEGFDGTSLAEEYISKINNNKTRIIGYLPNIDFSENKEEEKQSLIFKEDVKIVAKDVQDYIDSNISKNKKLEVNEVDFSEEEINKNYDNINLTASTGEIKNINRSILLVFVGVGVLVLLLAIKLIFKIK